MPKLLLDGYSITLLDGNAAYLRQTSTEESFIAIDDDFADPQEENGGRAEEEEVFVCISLWCDRSRCSWCAWHRDVSGDWNVCGTKTRAIEVYYLGFVLALTSIEDVRRVCLDFEVADEISDS